MSTHIHLLIQVPEREERLKDFGEEELWEHLRCLYSDFSIQEWRDEVMRLRSKNADKEAEAFLDKFRDRLLDVSAFWQQLKRRFTGWYNAEHERRGTLWEGRFRSVLVEETRVAMTAVAAYIDLNAVRAGMVEDPVDYPWSSYGAAVGGNEKAQEGLMAINDWEETEKGDWEAFMTHYRMLMYGEGMQRRNEEGTIIKHGFTPEEVEAVERRGGSLRLGQLLRGRVRAMTHGKALGSRKFIKGMYEAHKSYWSQRRSAASYGLKGGAGDWQGLQILKKIVD